MISGISVTIALHVQNNHTPCSLLVKVQKMSLNVEDTGFQCLFEGQNVILTCEIFGFPRPEIVFKRDDIIIIPEMESFERITIISLDYGRGRGECTT